MARTAPTIETVLAETRWSSYDGWCSFVTVEWRLR